MGSGGGVGVLSILISAFILSMSIYNDVISFLGPLVGGGVALAGGLSVSKKTGKLKETGLNADGIVFQLQHSSDVTTGGDDMLSSNNGSYPVIRFLIADQVWITGKPSSFVHSRYKEGQGS